MSNSKKNNLYLPVITTGDAVLFPNVTNSLIVSHESSLSALKEAGRQNSSIFVVPQLVESKNPKQEDLNSIGIIADIMHISPLPEGKIRISLKGKKRAQLVRYFAANQDVDNQDELSELKNINDKSNHDNDEILNLLQEHTATFYVAEVTAQEEAGISEKESLAARRLIAKKIDLWNKKTEEKLPKELIENFKKITPFSNMVDALCAQMQFDFEDKIKLLNQLDINERAIFLVSLLSEEITLLDTEFKIQARAKKQIDKNQQEYYLRERIKAIKQELGEDEDSDDDNFAERITKAKMTPEAEQKALKELKRLKQMPSNSSDAGVSRAYLDTLLDLPWNEKTVVNSDIAQAQAILNEDHFGLEKVKERIVEFLAVQKRNEKPSGTILCLVGPPGVGKTSLGKSIARATGRKYVRMALGGMHDEAEIRGHRRTYVGAICGQILSHLSKSGVKNPLFLLDEIDKMGKENHQGNVASALLEVLDPEQNNTFTDNYLEVPFDLSEVMFVVTANSLDIPTALLDRMEVIRLDGYTESEKSNIAQKYLIPREIEKTGLYKKEIAFNEEAVLNIIRHYTREAGVRELNRSIAKICRKVLVQHTQNEESSQKTKTVRVNGKNLSHFLGVHHFDFGRAARENRVGQVTGLAWTSVGGELLTIEAVAVKGKGNIIRTGKLGDVMLESITTACSVVRSRAAELGIDADFYEKNDLHIHAPEGATPKDGPSAGAAITLAMVSALTGIAVQSHIAMTGEITLRGEILPIGGLKEKLLAALRGGITQVLIPKDNVKDLAEIPDNVTEGLDIRPVQWIDEVFQLALERAPKQVSDIPPQKKPHTRNRSTHKH